MRRKLMVLLAISLFAMAVPVMAEEGQQHGAAHQEMDAQCAKECAMLLKNCAQEVDSIQGKIKKLQVQIKQKGADTHTLAELKALDAKLKDANNTLKELQKPGK